MTEHADNSHPADDIVDNGNEGEHSSVGRRAMFAGAAGAFAAVIAVTRSPGVGASPTVVSDVLGSLPVEPPSTGDTATTVPAAAAPTTTTAAGANTTVASSEVSGSAPVSAADLAIAGVAASLEVLAVNTYGAALDAATAGSLGDVPAAVAEFVTTARSHHQSALDAWNGVLTANGQPAVTSPPSDLEATVNDAFAAVSDVAGAAQLALMLEEIAAATYLGAIGTLESLDAIALAGSIQPIDRQHAAVLLFVLGMYPVPDTFATADMAYGNTAAVVPATSEPATTEPAPAGSAPAAGAMSVTIADFAFDPLELSVTAGSSVDWVNNDPFDHSVVADDGSFKSEVLKPGDHFTFQFPTAGTFTYKCGIHASMTASVTVTS